MKTFESIKPNRINFKINHINHKETEKKYEELYKFLSNFKNKSNPILLTIILPMFNEENTIRLVLENLPLNDAIEIIVIDDCSTDNSINEVKKVQSHRKIKLISHKKNSGYGGAIITGLNNARGEVIISMDSDGQHSSLDILNLIKPIFNNEVDCTVGSRYLGKYYYMLPITTRLGELVIEKLVQILFGIKIMNNQNGFRGFHKKMISIFNDIKYQGFAFATEVILLTILSGYRVKECPIILFDREYGTSKIILRKLAIDVFSCIFRYYLLKIKKLFFKKLV